MTDDRQQVIGSNLRRALLSQERLEIQTLQWEWHMAIYFERVHDFMSEALQVNAQYLQKEPHTL